MSARILLADDDASILRGHEMVLGEMYSVLTATTVARAKAIILREDVDVAVVDLNFEGQEEDGLALMDFILRERPHTAVIVLSGDVSTSRVSNSMRRPIVDFVVKGGDIEEQLFLAIDRGLERRRQYSLHQKQFRYQTQSPQMQKVLHLLERIVASQSQSPILILGEPGTGKEHLARHIGTLTEKKVVATSMANHSRDLADSALFGHKKGSFTGAIADRVGLVEQAQNGILFLDEIGEAPVEVQAKLLRVVQEKEFSSVGSNTTKQVNLRFIAATNRDLSAMVSEGTFKKDLLERLSTWRLQIPALRERPEDITFLTNVFLAEFASSAPFRVEPEGLDELLKYSWPGNIRELRNVIERITTISDTRILDREAVRFGIYQELSTGPEAVAFNKPASGTLSKEAYISALRVCNGNRSRAARLLKVHPTTLFRKLREWNMKDYLPGSPGRPMLASGDKQL